MYIMVKPYENLELLARDVVHELSILESRKKQPGWHFGAQRRITI